MGFAAICMFVLSPAVNAEKNASDIRDMYNQTIEASPSFMIKYEARGGVTRYFGIKNRKLLVELEEIYGKFSETDKAKNKDQYLREKSRYLVFASAADVDLPLSKVQILRGSSAIEVLFENGVGDNPRRESAKQRMLASFTGGDYTKYVLDRSKPEITWISLEPYPQINDTKPVYVKHSGSLKLGSINIVPPLADVGVPISLNHSSVVDGLLSKRNETPLRFFDLRESGHGVAVGAKFGRSLYLAGFDPKVSTFPTWTAELQYPIKELTEPLTLREVSLVMDCVRLTFSGDQFDMPVGLRFAPVAITKYSDFRSVAGLATPYPYSGSRRTLQAYQKDKLPYNSPDAKWGYEAISEDSYQVKAIDVNPKSGATANVEIPEGSQFVDLSLNKSGVVGAGETVVEKVLSGSEPTRSPWSLSTVVLVVVNSALFLAIVGYVAFKFRRKRLAAP